MKSSEGITILIGLIGLYYLSRSTSVTASPAPGQPGFVGPVQPASAGIPPAVNGPYMQIISCADPTADPVMCGLLAQ